MDLSTSLYRVRWKNLHPVYHDSSRDCHTMSFSFRWTIRMANCAAAQSIPIAEFFFPNSERFVWKSRMRISMTINVTSFSICLLEFCPYGGRICIDQIIALFSLLILVHSNSANVASGRSISSTRNSLFTRLSEPPPLFLVFFLKSFCHVLLQWNWSIELLRQFRQYHTTKILESLICHGSCLPVYWLINGILGLPPPIFCE